MLVDFVFDFETRSHIDLKKVGGVRYALDKSTEVTLLTYTFDKFTTIKYWLPNTPVPADLMDVLVNSHKYHFIAWNIAFDFLVWTQVLPRHLSFVKFGDIPMRNITDAAAVSNHYRTGSSLEAASIMCGFAQGKDKRGKAIMMKTCKPGRDGKYPTLTDEEFKQFILYGIKDTQLLRDVYYQLPALSSSERYAFEWTFRRNLAGLKLDIDLLKVMQFIVDSTTPKLEEEFTKITGLSPRSPKLIPWFAKWYPWVTSLDAENMEELLLDDTEVPDYVRRALDIKDLVGSSSISKIGVALEKNVNGYVYDILEYHKTQTKRWAGKGLQVQNFPRYNPAKSKDAFNFDLDQDNIAYQVLMQFKSGQLKDPVEFVKNLLRRMFPATKDTEIIAGDWSKIEPTVLFWMLGLGSLPVKWYEEMAAEIYNVPEYTIGKDSEERQIGKMANLSCGYGSGAVSFRKAVKKQAGILISERLATTTVKAYRRKYHQVAQFWTDLENAFTLAVKGQVVQLCKGKLLFSPFTRGRFKGVKIRLPSGGELYYHNARIASYQDPETLMMRTSLAYDVPDNRGIRTKYIYGGLICENVVSATARDIILPAIPRLESADFDVLNLIHDEIWGSATIGRGKEFEELMCKKPAWCLDMDIKAETTTGRRYLK